MKIIIDTNIFLDVILKREKRYENSARIWTYISDKKVGCISAINSGCEYIITCNIKDFPEKGISIVSSITSLK